MKKGLGVIVAEKNKDGALQTDAIVACDAKSFSISNPIVLQESNLKKVKEEHPLYICGHGNKRKRTISGLKMKDLAAMLKEHGYSGKQIIYVASCWSARKKHGKTIAEELQSELSKLGIECSCIALAEEVSLVYDTEEGVNCVFVHFTKLNRRFMFQFQQLQFSKVQNSEINRTIKENYDKVQNWNVDLAKGHYNALFSINSDLTIVVIAAMVALVCYCIGIPIKISEPLILVWLLAEFTAFRAYSLSVLLWVPIFTACFGSFWWLAVLRIVLGLACVIFVDCKYVKKYIVS